MLFRSQQDFLLLGIDQLVNTYNLIRRRKPESSFTIVNVVVDSGYEGPQSALNNFYDFCSIARISGFTVTNKSDVEKIIPSELVKPGFRIICVSQRLFNDDLIVPEKLEYVNEKNTVFNYGIGKDVTIVCFNLSFPYGFELSKKLKTVNISSSLFTVNSPIENEWPKIIEDVKRTKKLVVFEDSKSINTNMTSLLTDILSS